MIKPGFCCLLICAGSSLLRANTLSEFAHLLESPSLTSFGASSSSGANASKPSDEDHRIQKYVSIFYGRSQPILGSEDFRRGGGLMLGYGRRDPKLKIGNLEGELVWNAYWLETSSDGVNGDLPNTTEAYGLLASTLYRWKIGRDFGFYATLGFGVQYVDQTTYDLPLNLNTTPAFGLGVLFRQNGLEYNFGINLLPISNGGRKPPNPGQNFVVLSLGIRF